jgi:hypothetical protein
VKTSLLFCGLLTLAASLPTIVLADPIYADDFDAALPPVPEGIDTSLHTGVWLLSFKDDAIYESVDYDGQTTRTNVSTVGRVYSVIEPSSDYDSETDTWTGDHSRPNPLDLSCLPFEQEDGVSTTPYDWSGSYESINDYYNPITDIKTETGKLTVEINGAKLSGRGSFLQHPAGFKGRFNADNLIAHSLRLEGIKISNTAYIRDNDDLDTDIGNSCFGAIQETTTKNNDSTVTTRILPDYWTGPNEEIVNPPYFDTYDFHAEIFAAEQERTEIYQLILK